MPEVYRLLSADGAKIFYVSNSEANLFSSFPRSCTATGFPKGPGFLRKNKLLSYFMNHKRGHRSPVSHKMRVISLLMRTQPGKKFILVGDNGQYDPKIYKEVIRRFPGRIQYVFLRDIHDKIGLKRKCWGGVPVLFFSSMGDIKPFISARLNSDFN